MNNLIGPLDEPVIAITGLSRRFGSKAALDNVSLTVARGKIFGLVGENGAGKTTLIKHILGLLSAETGGVRVFGLDPVAKPVAVLGRMGYLSEQPDLPGWMRVDELMRYLQAFYPNWDPAYADQLRADFGLNPAHRLGTLSKGQQAKAGLLAAQAHRPELLLLDEPSSGLDPLVRHEMLEAVIRTVAEEGRTVFFSSHLLEEIERVSDHIAMLNHGRLVLCGALDAIKTRHRLLTVRFDTAQPHSLNVPGALSLVGTGRVWTLLCNGSGLDQALLKVKLGGTVVEERSPTLNEIFVAYAKTSQTKPTAPAGWIG